MKTENREYKDSMFADLFYTDETAEKNLLSLYNALHDTDIRDENLIRKFRLDNVLYKTFRNDISFEMDGRTIIFGEHQSTVNPNMPLRSLLYIGRAYEQIVDKKARYRDSLVKIPTPEFYTFYNGTKKFPKEKILKLSDAFISPAGENSAELKVTVININTYAGHAILDKCSVLREYSTFIETVRSFPNDKNAIEKAVNICISNGILAEYLKRKGSEVRNMLIGEYNYEDDIRVKQEEAWQLGQQTGLIEGHSRGLIEGHSRGLIEAKKEIARNMFANGDSLEKIAKSVIESIDTIREWVMP